MNILLIGKPGSGKSSLTSLLVSNKDINHRVIVAGDLLRAERTSGSELGKEIQSTIDRGALVPDAMINDIIEPFIEEIIIKHVHPDIVKYRSNMDELYAKNHKYYPIDFKFFELRKKNNFGLR